MRADRDILPQPAIRAGADGDSAALIALIARCWADYPGVLLFVDEEAPELRALASHYAALGGALWVTDDVRGMIAVKPTGRRTFEICRVYVDPELHGTGLGPRLMEVAEAHARLAGARRLELWTDTRFTRAHRFYEKRGYVRGGCRALNDRCHSEEWHYRRTVLHPVARSLSDRRRFGQDDRSGKKLGLVKSFVQHYARRRPKDGEPNDRRYSMDAKRLVDRLRPEELDRLLRDEDDE